MKPLAWYQIALPVAVCVAVVVIALRLPRYRFALLPSALEMHRKSAQRGLRPSRIAAARVD